MFRLLSQSGAVGFRPNAFLFLLYLLPAEQVKHYYNKGEHMYNETVGDRLNLLSKNVPLEDIREMGFTLEEILLDCQFGNSKCNARFVNNFNFTMQKKLIFNLWHITRLH